MPDIVTHLLVSKKFLEERNGSFIPLLKKHERLFYLSSQGPDIYYYHRYLVFRLDKPGVKLAMEMHNKKTGKFLKRSFECVKNLENREVPFVYFSGFLMHYLTDVAIHPYIFFRSGKHPPDSPDRWEHKKMETSIDVELLKFFEGIELKKFPYIAYVQVSPETLKPAFGCLNRVIKEIYNPDISIELENLTMDSYMHFISALKFSRDPFGVKKNILFPIISGAIGMKFSLSVFVHPVKPYYKDPLNLGKKTWRHPVTGEKKNTSIPEMIEEILINAENLLQDIHDFVYGKKKKLPPFFDTDYSYDTGMPSTSKQEMKFFAKG